MNMFKADDIRKFILDRYSEHITANGMVPDSVPDDYDLMEAGAIDSLGLIEMINAVEKAFNVEIDFEALEANEMTVIGPFCHYVEANGSLKP
jgi:acyl carrier protein